jgi:uroporphyrinogen-III synthase
VSAHTPGFDLWTPPIISGESYILAARNKGSHSGQKNPDGGKDRSPKPNNSKRILVFGRLLELALYRAEVLRNRGFSVMTPKTKAEAIAVIETGEFDALVLSYTLSSDTAEELIELARQKCPACPLITISDSMASDRKLRPDIIVRASEGPAALIKALHQMFRTQ